MESFRTLLKITHLAPRKLYLVILGPNTYRKLYLIIICQNSHETLSIGTLLKITCLAYKKSYLAIIGPNTHEKLTKYEMRSSYYLLQFGIVVFNCPDLTICDIFILQRYSSIETEPLCKILEQSDNNYSWRYCISKNWEYRKCRHECSLGVNLGIDNFLYLPSDISPLYEILMQSNKRLWRSVISKIWGLQKVLS